MNNNLKEILEESPGYYSNFSLSEKDLELFKDNINIQWFNNIKHHYPEIANFIFLNNIQIQNYHFISNKLEHSKIWPKISRILPSNFVSDFYSTDFFKKISKIFDPLKVSDEENLGYGNIYWRLVRPKEPNDIGPLHRDSWFWELNKDFPRPNIPFSRIKVWIAIETEPFKSGLLVEDDSHKRNDVKWKGEFRHGIMKPVMLSKESSFKMKLIPTNSGDVIFFNDNLVHGGALNKGKNTRVSVEFTLICKRI